MKVSLKHWESYRVKPGSRVRLASVATDSTEFCAEKSAARKLLKRYREEIDALGRALAAEEKRALLILLQGMDASGKDGAVRRVFTGVNPAYCRVVSFKEPAGPELTHDYLWRVYRELPGYGEIGVFNRSHYEDVIVHQARGDLSSHDAHRRLKQIAEVEAIWTSNGTVLRKIFLHISRAEQAERFRARLDTPEKHWKVRASDFADRKLWPCFQSAYEESLSRTATPDAPWYVLPADHKWYRDVALAGIVLSALRAMRPQPPMPHLNKKHFKI